MTEIDQASITDKNLDRLADFLASELEQPALASQIPSGAHIFHGAYNDMELTQANLKMATGMLLGMTLGLCEEAPLVMLFETKPGRQVVIDLSTEEKKHKVKAFTEMFQEQNKQEVLIEIDELMAA